MPATKARRDNTLAVPPFTEVVVPLDGSRRAERALGTATALAAKVGATLRLVLVAPEAHLETYLEGVAAGLDLASETELVVGDDPPRQIAEVQRTGRDHSIVVMASHAHTRIVDALVGSTTASVVRARPGPVVVVGPRCKKALGDFRTLAVPLDGSTHSETVLPLAASWARAMELRIVLLSVGTLFPWPPSEPDDYRLRRLAHDLWEEGLDAHVATTEDGSAVDGILRYVRQAECPLVAMATHARSGRDVMTTVNVATDLVRWSPAPVVLLRPLDAE